MANFKDWWNRIGSGIRPIDGHDYEEHGHRIAGLAVKACCRATLPDTHFEFTKEELEAVRVEIAANVSRGIRSGRVGSIYYEMQGERLDILDIEILEGISRDIDENQRYEIEEYVQAYS